MRARHLPIVAAAAWLLALSLAACNGGNTGGTSGEDSSPRQGKLSVYTSCFPVDWLTRRIAGDHADVVLILPIGEDPPEWTPPVESIAAMQGGDLVVINGANFEGWVATTTLPQDKIVDTTAGQREHLILIEEEGTHSHGKEGEHTHKGADPHTWSDPTMALSQAEAIKDALVQADPAHTNDFETAYKALAEEIEGLDEAYRASMAEYNGEIMATSHPAFNYLGRRYGLRLVDFGFEPDAAPDEMELQRLRETVTAEGITVLLWEAKPTPEVQATFDEMGLMSVFLDPLEQPAEGAEYDYLGQSKQNVAVLQGLFGGDVKPVEESAGEPAPAPTTP